MRKIDLVFVVALLAVTMRQSSVAEARPELAALRDQVEKLRQEWQVPGVALAIVRDGDLAFIEGFGLRDVEHAVPFTPDTLIRVASTTKSFTAALVGQLVDEGVVEWDRPVREYHPDFQMVDAFATAEMTLEDMMCHRSGLPYHENLLAAGVGRELTGSARGYRESLIRRLRFFEPSHAFRTHFQYQDVIFTCAGAILENVTDTNYETLVKKRLLQPLGMERSTFSRRVARESGSLSLSYAEVDGKVVPIDFIDISYLAPSAGLYSTAREMIKWVKFNLDEGRVGDRQLVSKRSMKWVHRSHMVVGARAAFKSEDVTYGQGWFRSQHRGHLLVSHGGSFNGHRTTMAFIPGLDLGVIAICNLNLTEYPELLIRVVFDQLLGIDAISEWNQHFRKLKNTRWDRERAEADNFRAARRLENSPRHELPTYAGTYTHPGYGTFVVAFDGKGLVQTYDGRTFDIKLYDGETFATRWQSTENHLLHLTMKFRSDREGRVVAVVVPLIPGIDPHRFVRQ